MSVDVTALPSELLVAPQPLIGFCGLDTSRNVIHKSIWDAFSSNRKTDRAAAQYKLLLPNYEFPVAIPKRASYEWYQPKGILKRNWMLKHLHVLPAVVVLFQDMEWSDPHWSEKQLQCAATLQAIKSALQERNTRICLVLIQKSAPLSPGEDVIAAERAASLTAACGISNKMLFILPHTEHLLGYVTRLESTFLDMALTYYGLMSKRIRTHRDQLTAAHITLKIRHQFKLGFVGEMREDFSTALKHYTQSYSMLDEVRTSDTTCLEIKTVAGFLNYKICRLMFKLKVPRDAINHFISHIDRYKNRLGCKDIAFEHYAWLSTQHSLFAELFCEAIKNGLPALQTQHPGIYFHKAAEYMQKRKECFLQSQSQVNPEEMTTTHNISIPSLFTEFFGIRAVKGEDQQEVNAIIKENEKHFNHSAAIIHLLGQAMAQFKIYKCLRFRKKLAIDMADEYFKNGDQSKALTLYSLMLPDYRQDQWTLLFSDVLLKTMRCSLLSASISDFICCSLEALSLKINYKHNERVIVLENLWKVLQGEAPIAQTIANENQNVCEVRTHWEDALAKFKSPLLVNMDKLTDLIEIYGTFQQIELKSDHIIHLNVILKLQTDVPLKVHNLHVIITDNVNNFKLQATQYSTYKNVMELRKQTTPTATDTDNECQPQQQFKMNMKLEPSVYYKFTFTTEAQQFIENTQLRIVRFELLMGTDRVSILMMKSPQFTRNAFRYYNRSRDLDDNIIINPICYITPTFHLITQSNLESDTILVNEYYPVVTTITNPYNVFVQAVTLNISIPANLKNKVFLATETTSCKQKLYSNIQIDIGDLAMQGCNTITYFLYSLVATTITLHQKISYISDVLKSKTDAATAIIESATSNNSDDSPETNKSQNINNMPLVAIPPSTLGVVAPIHLEFINKEQIKKARDTVLKTKCETEFKFCGRLYTLSRKPLTKVYRGEDFLLRAIIEIQTGVDLEILETYFICDHNLVQSTYSFKRKKGTNIYRCGDKLEDAIILRVNSCADEWITLKDYEGNKNDQCSILNERLLNCCKHLSATDAKLALITTSATPTAASAQFSKCLIGKISNNMTIINSSSIAPANANKGPNQYVYNSNSDDSKLMPTNTEIISQTHPSTKSSNSMRTVYNKTLDAVQVTGPLRGFVKAAIQIIDCDNAQQPQAPSQMLQQQPVPPIRSTINLPPNQHIFGIYCIKWRRHNGTEENESKFAIHGPPIEEPPLNIYCSIEERVYVKMPMTYKVLLKNPTARVLHLIATLVINNTDPFICSGHKQLDITIVPFGEKSLVYNLYPYKVGWHNLPQLILEYNCQIDPTKDESQNNVLADLMQRSMPKQIFILPHLKQHNKGN